MRCMIAGLLAGALIAGAGLAETTPGGAYDLIFRTGVLDRVPRDAALVYESEVANESLPEAAELRSGELRLSFPDDSPDAAALRLTKGERFRAIGTFPADVGNPVAMYFVETVVRDMAQTMGGSPFYIRNRLKEALLRPAEIESTQASFDGAEIGAQVVTLHPFENDPARNRMGAFADMELSVTVSDEVPGWYYRLVATAPGTDGPVYAASLTLAAPEDAQ